MSQLIGDKFRFLSKTPLFDGGFINFSKHFSLTKDKFLSNFKYLISLNEETTNDIVRKFSSYISRGGVSTVDFEEAKYYLKSLND